MPHNKGKAMAIYTLSPILGPVIGPIAGGFIAERSTWRWVFWSTSAFALFIQCIGLWGLTESHAPTLLRRKRERLVKETGNTALHTGEGPPMSLPKRLADAFTRPLKMFATQPIVMLISVYIAYIFGLNYLLFVIFPGVYTGVYGEPIGIAGLHYAALGIGLIIGLFVQFFFIDKVYMRLKKRNNNVGRPEFRIPTMVIGSVLVTAGLFWYGWSVQARNHWVVPDLGIIVFSAGTMICLNGMQTYIIETYMKYAASAMAASAILRSLCGFSFPLFAPYLYNALGYGWGTSVLAFISIAIGWTAPFIFWFYGPKLRAVSKFASG
jgi:MFS family permease